MKNYLLSGISVLLVSAALAFSANSNVFDELFNSESSQTSNQVNYSASIMANCPPATADPYIGGKVFKDIDMDGQNDANIDQAIENVTITVFNLDGDQVGTATSESDGTYLISSSMLSAGEKYRVEFSAWSDDYLPSFSGVNNASDIQFVSGSTCGVDFALTNPNDYCQANPKIVTSCYAEGDQSSATDVLVSFDYNNPSTVNHEAIANQIGTTYGLAYQRNSGKLFAASFMKRFAGFPAGNSPSSIYMISNPTNNANEAALFVDLDDLTGAPANVAGADIHDFSLDPTSGEILDAAAFDAIGKYSFGDIDLASDELSIYAMNLFDRSIYQIPLGTDPKNPTAPTAFSELSVFPLIGNLPGLPAGVTTNEIRPFALKVQGDFIYVGLVTSGQNGNTMQGLIYSFDINNSTTGSPSFTKVLDFPLNYARGCGFASPSGCAGPADWNKWEDSHPEYPNNPAMPIFTSAGNALEEAHPQPMITDIEFDAAGNMILGMRDRYGDQCGLDAPYPSGNQLKYPPNGAPLFLTAAGQLTLTDTGIGLYTSRQDAFGDILKATKSGSSWSINIADFTDSSQSSGVNQAGILTCPDSESSFGEDCYHADGFLHEETAMGGLAVLLRNNQVVTPSMDPAQSAFSNGIDWFNADNGELTQYFEVLTGASSPFGKAYGLGEIEFICDMPPVQIGNYVWQDEDNDGIQDANEEGIEGVDVVLYKGSTPIATTETTADGKYYFSNQSAADPNLAWLAGGIDSEVLPETEYTVQIANVSGGSLQAALSGLSLVEANINSNADDRIDNDGELNGNNAEVTIMTGKAGEAKHSFDFGFAPCQTQIVASSISSCSAGEFTSNITLDWTNAPITGGLEYSIDGGTFQDLIRTNFSTNATAELFEISGLVCNMSKKVEIRFKDSPECYEQLMFVFPPADPAGYFYCDNTGAIVTGGTISVTPPAGGNVIINDTGVNGYYSWIATGSPVTEGRYTMTYTPPTGFSISGTPGGAPGDTDNICDPTLGSEDNPSSADPLLIGTSVNAGGTALDDFSAAANPFFLEFELMLSDPFVDNNNIGLSGCANCNIQLSSSTSSCIDDGDGTYSATLDVTIDWEDSPDPAENIVVTLNGANAHNINTSAAGDGSQTIQFNIDADGENILLNAEFVTTTSCSGSTTIKAPIPCVADITPDCTIGIAGQAYLDDNENGANDDAGTGVAGVHVLAYDCDNNLIGSTYTDADGEYQIPNTNTTDEYRIEFVISDAVACDAKPTFAGGTTVQFGTAGTCYDLGFLDLNATEIPDIVFGTPNAEGKIVIAGAAAVSCGVVNSMPDAAKFSFGIIDVRTIAYAADRPQISPGDFHHPSWHVDQIGNVFGIDFDADRNIYVTASTHYGYGFFGQQSVIKFGTLGGGEEDLNAAGTIYKLDASTGQASVFAQLPQQAAAFGHGDCESGLNLPRNTGPALGNIAFDKFHNQFFVSNFEDGKIYRLDTDGNILNSFDPFVADSGAAGFSSDKNPYGLALSPDGSKLFFGTHEMNLAPGLYSIDLDALGDFNSTEFFHTALSGNGVIGGGFTSGPWVCVSDIEFRPDGKLIAAIRTGCENNFATSHNHGGTYYILEDSDSDGKVDEVLDNPRIHYPNDPFGPDDGYGGVGIFDKQDGTYDYVVSNADIRNESGPHGIMVFPDNYTTTGTGSQYILQPTAAIPYYAPLAGSDLKGWGGEVQVYSGQDQVVYPIEIGNYVWFDINQNGIQDACEAGIDGVTVKIYDAGTCTLVGSTTTANGGNYIFNDADVTGGIQANTDYIITTAEGQYDNTTGVMTVGGNEYFITDQNIGSNDFIDSDASAGVACGSLPNVPFVAFTTEMNACHSHDVDFGFKPTCATAYLGFQQNGNTVSSICIGETVDLKITHSPTPGDMAIYEGPAGLTVAQLYDFANHGTNGITVVNSVLSATSSTSTMISETGLSPTSETTYYAILANGNIFINDPDCLPFSALTLPVFTLTPTATVSAGPHDLCSEDSPYVSGTNNVIDLQTYITSGDTGGIWTSTDAPAGSLSGSTFTATQAMEGTTYNFIYTIAGMTTAPGLCDDNVYNVQIAVKDCYAAIGNYVWEDTNGNGVQDETGTEQSDIKVILYEAVAGVKGDMVTMMETNSSGEYLFDLLIPGEYAIQFDLPNSTNTDAADFTITGQNSTVASATAANNSDASQTDGCTAGYVLAAGDENLTVDAGLIKLASIGNYVWEDTNANGIQDETNTGIENVLVTLTGTNGLGNAVSETTNTAANGSYLFDDLVPGDYKLTFGTPTDFTPTAADDPSSNGTDLNDSDADVTTGMTTVTSLESGEDDDSWDAGFFEVASIGNYVWEDTNADGVQDETGTGLEGVLVNLTGTDGLGNTVSETMNTETDGSYLFDDLVPGDYKLTFATPTDFVITAANDPSSNGAGDDSDDSDVDVTTGMTTITTLESGEEDLTWDAGLYNPASIGNYVWEDLNGNGIQDETGTGISNFPVTLTGIDGLGNNVSENTVTAFNGLYLFDDLVPGDYKITFNAPANYSSTILNDNNGEGLGDDTDDSDADPNDANMTTITTLVSGENDLTWDAGFYETASLGNYVWEDTNANGIQDELGTGIQGVEVTLLGTDMFGDFVNLSMSTDMNGSYSFENLVPGDYKVTFMQPAGYVPTGLNDSSSNGAGNDNDDSDADANNGLMTTVTNLESGENDPSWDAGFYQLASISNLVFEDTNANGVQDGVEPGIDDVMVTLTGTDGLGNSVSETTNTITDGTYIFDDLVPGDYELTFETPTGYEPTGTNDPSSNGVGNDMDDLDASITDGTTGTTSLVSNEDDDSWDAGFYELASLGDYVWEDTNADGVQDELGTGIEGVEVTLTGIDGLGNTVSETTNTIADGTYIFEDLVPGNYNVTFAALAEYIPTGANDASNNGAGADEDDSDANITNGMTAVTTLISGEYDPTWDAGFYQYASISDLVFEDTNADGAQSTNEPGIEEAIVTLNGTDGLGNSVSSTITTQPDGTYIFEDLVPGEYELTFTTPIGYEPTGTNDPSNNGAGNDIDDSDASTTDGTTGITILVSNEDDDSWDAGFYELAGIGKYVWIDTNADGVQDEVNTGLEGVLVTLNGIDGLGNTVTATTNTNVYGTYIFKDLVPGDYYVTFETPAGYQPTGTNDPSSNGAGNDMDDSDASTINGTTEVTNLISSEFDLTWDAGFYQFASISNLVFEDTNANGIQDTDEPGIEGVTVVLEGTDGLNNSVTETIITNPDGSYLFEDLVPGEYELTFETPTDYIVTGTNDPSGNGAGDDTDDSDVSIIDGTTGTTILESGEDDDSWDAGYYESASIGNFVFVDFNDNGAQDVGEIGIEDVKVILTGTDGLGNPVTATAVTAPNGTYTFDDLVPGEYNLTFSVPTDMQSSDLDATTPAGDDTDDSDADPGNNSMTIVTTLISDEDDDTWDAGFYATDFGDNPDSFGTEEVSNGAVHVINLGKYLGAGVDAELDGSATAQADGDDNDASTYNEGTVDASGNDDDGIVFNTPLIAGHEACITATATVSGNAPAYLTGWIDFNGDGTFTTDEQLQFTAGADALIATGTTEYCFEVPANAIFEGGETHARFRLSCETGVEPTGQIIGGEVEDYYIPLMKVGNLVWQDVDNEGDQDELDEYGLNDIVVHLTWAGEDNNLGTADDVIFIDTTATENGVDGKYCFIGVTPGNYEISIPEYPANFQQAPIDATGDDTTDNDGDNYQFTIVSADNQPTGENSTGDEPGNVFPDNQDDLTIDIALVAFDYGDLPDDFGTTVGNSGANHVLEPGLFLGVRVDAEMDGNPDPDAGVMHGGDNDGGAQDPITGTVASDEEGIEFLTPFIPGNPACIRINGGVPSGEAYFKAWIDFNGDGDFEGDAAEELVFIEADATPISPTNEMTYTTGIISQKLTFMVPTDATFDGGETHFRFRFGRDQGISFTGEASGGEVEDYWRPLAKVGNLVWREYDEEGDQDEAATLGLDGVQVNLIYEGEDATIGTADDITYTTFTAPEDGVNGKYTFCGLTSGNYQVVVPTIPADMIISPTNAVGNPILDADPLTVDLFIEDAQGLFPFENGMGDDAPSSFPTENDLLVIDFAFSALDFGDLPTSFANTTDADNGAYHVINPSIYLGQGVDSEVDGAPENQAGTNGTGGDDQTASAIQEGVVALTGSDEDGIEFISPIIPGEKAYVRVTAHTAANSAVLNAWIDYDGDGTFAADGSEQIMWTATDATTYVPTTEGVIPVGDNTQIMCFEVPANAVFEGAETHIRMRLSSAGGLSPNDKALDGEVEDYFIPMVKVGNLVWRDLQIDGQQDPQDLGMNDILLELTTEGPDGTIGTADDYVYQTTSATDANGQDGHYQFCGLLAGDYTLTSYGDGSLPTISNEAGVAEDMDSDGVELVADGPEVVAFTIVDAPVLNNQPTGESGIGDIPNDANFPDANNNIEFDFGYQGLDYGDLPNTFVTLQQDGGASHVIIQDIFLGDRVDLDIDGAPTYESNGDNESPSAYTVGAATTTGNDEDGITFLTPLIPGEKATIQVKHTSTIGDALLNAWIDWNGDGLFAPDGTEQLEWTIVDGTTIPPTKNGLLPTGTAITQDFCFNVPTDATFEGGETHIRVRMSTAGDLTPTGLTVNGEVEDYYLPLAKVGNVVWFDEDLYGDEDEAAQTGINDFPVELVYAGKDGILDTDDDILYTEITKNINGQDGSYYFCGLIDANYRLQYSEYPAGMISAIFDNTGNDFNDNDADFDFVSFEIENGAETNVLNENEVGDDTNPDNFPDIRTNLSVDFAFVNMPRVGTSLSLQGVQEPTSETCGNFDAIYQTCIQNTGDAPLENIQAMFDFAAADMFGDAYVSLSVAPIILSDNSQETPQFSAAFDGSTAGKNLFDGTSGLLFPTEEICIQFTVELRPVAETAPPVMQIQSMVTGGAVNFDGTPIPDVLNAEPQFIADDLSDDGLLANDTNPGSANDTGGVDDASALNDCFESNALACNDLVQISVDEMCSAGLTEDMVLENLDDACGIGALPLGGFYTVTLMNNLGQPIPNNEVTADMYGEELTVKVRHIVSCNDCWGQVIIEDKDAPEFDCPTDPIVVDCTDDLTAIAAPIAIDNCNTNGVTVTLVNESTNDDEVCTSVIITREYTAIDEQGNQTEENCIQTIEIQTIDAVDFPEDVNWSCEQYAANPSITDATQAGSGMPDVSEGTYCNFGVTSSDEIVSICSSTNTFKIIRTWTVLNWCTNSLVTTDINGDDNIQLIKVLDDVAPVITAENVSLSANIAGEHPQPCLSTDALPAASITDNCSGVASVEIHTPIGTIFGNGGNIPEPGLGIGTHNVTYVATDGCGNTSELTVQITVVDDYTPTPVCEEITQVAIGSDGIVTVLAETFDDGSNDNCGIDYFEVRRLTDNCAIAGNTTFGESVQFCCADIDATDIMVEFRVVDYYGNANTCMVQVLVEDKLAPIKLNNPADEAIDCDDYFVNIAPALDIATANGETNPQILIDMFGEAIYDDNCEEIVTTNFTVNINSCGQGTITRTWAATDPSGNIGQSCTQVITVNHVNDWNVEFPADVDLSCTAGQDELDGQDFGEPIVFEDDCELIVMSSEDQVFDVVEGACYQMIRTWTVINWCVYDGDNQDDDTTIDTRTLRDGNDGIITYQQQIRVTDEVAPAIANPGTQFRCIDTVTDADGDCDMNIQLDEATVTDCSDDVTITYAITALGTGRNYTNVAPGIYDVTVTATDGCGNQSTITYDLDVRDCKAPTPYCAASLIIELMPMDEDGDGTPDAGMVETWANDFNAGSFDNCTAEENLVFTASIGEDNFDASTSNLLFDCTMTGAQSIYMYVTDEAGNMDYCLTTVFIESVDNVCPEDPTPSDPIISGAIMTEEGNGVDLTEVHVNGASNSMEMTNEAGQHTTTVMQDGDYTVSPLRDDDHDNGVTTFDLVLIRQHVLNTNLLGSPYKLIAADANNSGSVTTSDIVLLRQLILTMIDELPANTSWRFVDTAYEFENPANPWATEFPEITNYNNVDADILDANFVGIKIGDVNGTAQANLTQDVDERSTGEVIFRTQDADLKVGEEYTVNLGTVKELRGYQFTLDFDTDILDFAGLSEQMKSENFGTMKTEAGAITVSIDRNPAEVAHVELIFKVLEDRKLSKVLNISSRFTKAEAYDTDDNLLDISLEFGMEENPTFVLLQNTPNPWSDKTTIGFNLPTATRAEIRIYDAAGKTLRVIEQSFETGYNEVTLDGKGMGTQTILYYTIKTNTHSATKSMVRVQ